MNNPEALQNRIAAGMVDDTFRDNQGEPLLALHEGVVVPNGAASNEESLRKAQAALMVPPRYPVNFQPEARFVDSPEDTLARRWATQRIQQYLNSR